ncbi:TetR/AcrR family transcriptional regulator [Micromonospora sp. WMMD1128]|uniref:TetR/AcrR family transcriptional regulator n=1 Tax=unclassified Micromonospora TaxID=2617518 RepID=UPI00248B0794|nr:MULTISPECIES: TetR/AcrR family transcriptional regulator [unclassified Micromonospora]WBB75910.1 TetR/AcrR family transcriptional regulator [Micromonospora sp. WMMD1128]WFE36304.1 TetR/AcrR family transcriptional regulator [Micromonospora sp. WMMD975]
MPPPDSSLRTRLVSAGVDLLAREGAEALTLRAIARRAGVSHGAPRRYFPTHLALLAAIAREGYQQLGREVAETLARQGDADPHRQLLALGRLYLTFARTHRGMFELMFRHDLLRGNGVGLREASEGLFGVLVDLVTRARPEVPGSPAPQVVAGALWANLHGIAELGQWGSLQLMVRDDDLEPLLRAALTAHLDRRITC